MIDEAVVICTRNRPDDLRTLLEDLKTQSGMARRIVLVVDGSDGDLQAQTETVVRSVAGLRVEYRRFEAPPSLARQRNLAVESLDPQVQIVHFLDDDVTLEPGSLDRISEAFSEPSLGGAGGSVKVTGRLGRKPTVWKRIFLLDSKKSGVVLVSGASTPAQGASVEVETETDWLGGCASYRRSIILEERFDDCLEGYSLDEDVDFSYRVSRNHRLKVIPEAVIHHHESASGRSDPKTYARQFLIHRYWFLEKNIRSPYRKVAFWWSALGRLLAVRFGSGDTKEESLAGLLEGVHAVWRRDHPLLKSFRQES